MYKTVSVSRAFLDDRMERDLPCGTGPIGKSNKAVTTATDDVLADMVADAAYQGWFTDASPAGTVRAARTAFRDLVKAGVRYRQGVKRASKTGLPMPKDAHDAR